MRERCSCGKAIPTGELRCRACTRDEFHGGSPTRRLFATTAGRLFALTQVVIAGSPLLHVVAPYRAAWVTSVIVAATAALSVRAQRDPEMKVALLHDHEAIYAGERHRIASSAYIHGGVLHLGFNMLAFYSFGRALESYYVNRWGIQGGWLFAMTYLLGAVATGVTQYLGEKRFGSTLSLGASGVVLMVISATIVLDPSSLIMFLFIPLPGWLFLALFSAVSVYALLTGNRAVDAVLSLGTARINHLGHLAGVVAGVALGALLLS